MENWLEKIKENNLYKQSCPISHDMIADAEKELGISFADDFKDFLQAIGGCMCFGHEIKGITHDPNFDVIYATKEIRKSIDLVPHSWYVVEDTHMDGIVILQDKNGVIYQMSPNTMPTRIAKSLEHYIFDMWDAEKNQPKNGDPFSDQIGVDAALSVAAQRVLNDRIEEARKTIENPDQVEVILQQVEKKLEKIPGVGDWLADVPAVISLVRSYIKKEYRAAPIGSIIAALAALLYIVSPVDIIPDFIPGAGLLDDAAVFVVCWKMIHDDVDAYQAWRKMNGKALD